MFLNHVGDLNSEKFYKGLEDLSDYTKYFNDCESLNTMPNGRLVRNYCARLLKYLETNSFSRNNDNEYDYCLLLNYWVYSSLNIILHSKYPSQIVPAFGNIVFIWNSFIKDKLKKPENEICKPNSDIIMHKDWRDRKELYEYYVDYKPIIQTVKNYSYTCKEYYHYVENKKKIYKHFKKHCPSDDTKKCPKYYTQCEPYNPEYVLPTLECHKQIIKEREADASSALQKAKVHSVNEFDSEDSDDRMRPDDGPKFSGNPHTVTKLGNVLLGVVATSMTSGALYRVNINSLIQINCINLLI
ncbi:hypothetical protein PVIIG_05845 [Plasmodium vivax India VII]|uniref:Variable surface protein Vir4 n=1 Tax=Plasmodium vivax India VII TaxID=1077284 RepID=A0A0J9S1Z4_PLAVI|nr:hypothetical protein PVIIG_05845 [Plasmodium vivax India VII]